MLSIRDESCAGAPCAPLHISINDTHAPIEPIVLAHARDRIERQSYMQLIRIGMFEMIVNISAQRTGITCVVCAVVVAQMRRPLSARLFAFYRESSSSSSLPSIHKMARII